MLQLFGLLLVVLLESVDPTAADGATCVAFRAKVLRWSLPMVTTMNPHKHTASCRYTLRPPGSALSKVVATLHGADCRTVVCIRGHDGIPILLARLHTSAHKA